MEILEVEGWYKIRGIFLSGIWICDDCSIWLKRSEMVKGSDVEMSNGAKWVGSEVAELTWS